MADRMYNYTIVGRCINADDTREVIGYKLKNLANGSEANCTRAQLALFVGRGLVDNCDAQIYKDKLIFRGKGINLDSLPTVKISTKKKKDEGKVQAGASVGTGTANKLSGLDYIKYASQKLKSIKGMRFSKPSDKPLPDGSSKKTVTARVGSTSLYINFVCVEKDKEVTVFGTQALCIHSKTDIDTRSPKTINNPTKLEDIDPTLEDAINQIKQLSGQAQGSQVQSSASAAKAGVSNTAKKTSSVELNINNLIETVNRTSPEVHFSTPYKSDGNPGDKTGSWYMCSDSDVDGTNDVKAAIRVQYVDKSKAILMGALYKGDDWTKHIMDVSVDASLESKDEHVYTVDARSCIKFASKLHDNIGAVVKLNTDAGSLPNTVRYDGSMLTYDRKNAETGVHARNVTEAKKFVNAFANAVLKGAGKKVSLCKVSESSYVHSDNTTSLTVEYGRNEYLGNVSYFYRICIPGYSRDNFIMQAGGRALVEIESPLGLSKEDMTNYIKKAIKELVDILADEIVPFSSDVDTTSKGNTSKTDVEPVDGAYHLSGKRNVDNCLSKIISDVNDLLSAEYWIGGGRMSREDGESGETFNTKRIRVGTADGSKNLGELDIVCTQLPDESEQGDTITLNDSDGDEIYCLELTKANFANFLEDNASIPVIGVANAIRKRFGAVAQNESGKIKLGNDMSAADTTKVAEAMASLPNVMNSIMARDDVKNGKASEDDIFNAMQEAMPFELDRSDPQVSRYLKAMAMQAGAVGAISADKTNSKESKAASDFAKKFCNLIAKNEKRINKAGAYTKEQDDDGVRHMYTSKCGDLRFVYQSKEYIYSGAGVDFTVMCINPDGSTEELVTLLDALNQSKDAINTALKGALTAIRKIINAQEESNLSW